MVAALALIVVVAIAVWFGGLGAEDNNGAGAAETGASIPAADLPQLPGGGRRIFPDRRVVAFAGNPRDEGLGALGIGTATSMVAKLRKQAAEYERKTRPVLPALELITSIAAVAPGATADHVIRTPAATIDRYLRIARAAGALLLLDVQPGLADFPSEVRRLQKWLLEPDVGIALDPEWRVQPGEIPGQVIGSVTAAEVNATSAYVAQLVWHNHLPEKLFVVHQFTEEMVKDPERLVRRPGLAMLFNVDGVGTVPDKVAKYQALTAGKPGFRHGLKLFYKEDEGRMAPQDVMSLLPRPDMVVYE